MVSMKVVKYQSLTMKMFLFMVDLTHVVDFVLYLGRNYMKKSLPLYIFVNN